MPNMSQIAGMMKGFTAVASPVGFRHVTCLCFSIQEWDVDYLTEEEDGLIYFDGGTFSRGPHWLLPPPAAETPQGEPEEVQAALACAVLLSCLKLICEHRTLAICLARGLGSTFLCNVALLSIIKSMGEHQTLAICLAGGSELPMPA